jgi:hypothetical protein
MEKKQPSPFIIATSPAFTSRPCNHKNTEPLFPHLYISPFLVYN